jgi:hypothetical protein
MVDSSKIREHLHVHSSDGEHIGTVDKLDGNRIKLTKQDRASGGHHHTIPLDWVRTVDDHAVHLSKSAAEARREWAEGTASR